MKILFICKYNRFRSRIAEAYFRKINKNKKIISGSAGIFQGSYPLDRTQVRVAKELGINIEGKPRAISTDLLRNIDLIIIVANDVPESLFSSKNRKIIKWNISDVRKGREEKEDRKVIIKIMKKVDKLNKKLESTARCTPNYRIRGQK